MWIASVRITAPKMAQRESLNCACFGSFPAVSSQGEADQLTMIASDFLDVWNEHALTF